MAADGRVKFFLEIIAKFHVKQFNVRNMHIRRSRNDQQYTLKFVFKCCL
jgi:hypothetical protein